MFSQSLIVSGIVVIIRILLKLRIKKRKYIKGVLYTSGLDVKS